MPEYPRPDPSPDHPANQPPPPLPCPFCGTTPEVMPAGSVACRTRGCVLYDKLQYRPAWNTRAPVATPLAPDVAADPVARLLSICLAIASVCAALILGVGLPALALGLLARVIGLR